MAGRYIEAGTIRRILAVVALISALAALLAAPAAGSQAAPATSGSPFGFLDNVALTPDGVLLSGWAADPDTSQPIDVHLYNGTTFVASVRADGYRPDVAAAYPSAGDHRGFSRTIASPDGVRTFCAYAINVGAGAPYTAIGCRTLNVSRAPFGWLDTVQRIPGTPVVHVTGWALDPDTPEPVDVHIWVSGSFTGSFRADRNRPDVAGFHPWAGPQRGFDVSFELWEGSHQVCVFAINVGAGAAYTPLGCRSLLFTSTPLGQLETVRSGNSAINVTGWALDQDTTAAVEVQFRIDGYFAGSLAANGHRADIGAAYPSYGPARGYSAVLWAWPGARSVCAYAINAGPGPAFSTLGCRALDPLVPADSGAGRRIVYANLSQRVWLVAADGFADRTYPVSGKYLDPPPGRYHVYGFFRWADAGHDGITMEYFVAFHPAGLGYGFHTIPVNAYGVPLQREDELGFFRSAGCVRQRRSDAVYLWNWSTYGDPVIVLGR